MQREVAIGVQLGAAIGALYGTATRGQRGAATGLMQQEAAICALCGVATGGQ